MDSSFSTGFAALSSNYSTLAVLSISLVVISLSAYVKIATVLGILRVGIGFNSLPSAFVCGALSLSLSYFVMFPILEESSEAMKKVLDAESPVSDVVRMRALRAGSERWSDFMRTHTNPEILSQFALRSQEASGTSFRVLAPAFLVSQLQEAFSIGLRIFLPLLAIDIVIGILVAAVGLDRQLGVSLGFAGKILLFIACDGWSLIAGSILSSF